MSFSDLLHLVWSSLGHSMLLQIALFHYFVLLNNFPLCDSCTYCLRIYFDHFIHFIFDFISFSGAEKNLLQAPSKENGQLVLKNLKLLRRLLFWLFFLSRFNPKLTALNPTNTWLNLECCSFQFNKKLSLFDSLALSLWDVSFISDDGTLVFLSSPSLQPHFISPSDKGQGTNLARSHLLATRDSLVPKWHFSKSPAKIPPCLFPALSGLHYSPHFTLMFWRRGRGEIETDLVTLYITMLHWETLYLYYC